MFNDISPSAELPYTYFENSLGRLLEHPTGQYITIEFWSGPRQLLELADFLTHAGQLLARWGWDKLRGHQSLMTSFTSEETEWLATYWCSQATYPLALLYGAQLLPHEVFARLSWKAIDS
jgi:hypothetical protein